MARLIAHRVSRGQRPCSAETGAYCQARKRLPEEFFSEVARQTGTALEANAKEQWLWKGRRVLAYDGSTVSMPDTPENQQAYPQPPQQKPGVGFPLARIAAFFSLSCGAVVDLAICRYSGKGNSELGMLRKLWDILLPGDVMLADRYMCAWYEIFMLKERGVDSVIRLSVHRSADFRRGRRLGKGDHIVVSGGVPVSFVRLIGKPSNLFQNSSPSERRVCKSNSRDFAAGPSSLSRPCWMPRRLPQ